MNVSSANLTGANENPGALAGATGAKTSYEGVDLPAKNSLKDRRSAMSKWAKPAHKEASRQIGYALTLGDFDGWHRVAINLSSILNTQERAALAWAGLASLDHDQRESVAACLITGAGSPLPTLMAPMEDARFWASLANRRERKAYALAAFEAMPPRDQAAFLRHLQGRAAA